MASRVYLLVLLINLCFAAKKDEKVDFWLSLNFSPLFIFLITLSRKFLQQLSLSLAYLYHTQFKVTHL